MVGRIMEKVIGRTYEQAVDSLVLEPLGLSHTFFAPEDVMTRRFAVGHNPGQDGTPSVARLWRGPRCRNPGGGTASSVADQLRWARFHLGDGRAASGDRVLPTEVLHRMKEPTVALRGARSAMPSASAGSYATSTAFALSGMAVQRTASSPSSSQCLSGVSRLSRCPILVGRIPCNQAVVRWALEAYLGVVDRDAEPLPYDETRANEVVGRYDIDVMSLVITTDETKLTSRPESNRRSVPHGTARCRPTTPGSDRLAPR